MDTLTEMCAPFVLDTVEKGIVAVGCLEAIKHSYYIVSCDIAIVVFNLGGRIPEFNGSKCMLIEHFYGFHISVFDK